ncbi:PREDICTED: uncharacterized protein LOC103581982 [Galeopterus variegatus]|uniref:Uncharacterized protein LOC103581982 n=1 Tax=Galeopterus variegatus TaxID=482537 RepID=A0ABM0Q0K5_GALVR|nr:PREDICTED: uncharacterized protein LOC103581982 [Galeopterus variegatus]
MDTLTEVKTALPGAAALQHSGGKVGMQPRDIRTFTNVSKGSCDHEHWRKFVQREAEITGQVVVAGVYNFHLLLPALYDTGLQRASQLVLVMNDFQRFRFTVSLHGHSKLCCPADIKEKKCGARCSYPEVRRSAILSASEQRDFEQKLALSAVRLYCDFKECPGCRSLVERKDLTSLRVLCTICTSTRGKDYEFCWQCLKAWKGPGTSSVRCGNEGCRDQILHILATCATKDLPDSEVRGCPSIRACPTCGLLIEHKERCKYVMCPQCHVEFCFACLETAQACQATRPNSWFRKCTKSLAPRQSHVPVWSQLQQRSPRESHVDHGNNQQQHNRPPVDSDGRCVIL